MCPRCVKNPYPDRGTVCLDDGAYLANYAGCHECGKKEELLIQNRVEEDDGEEETVTYQHVCRNCDHLVANHEHKFGIEDEFQEYEMRCLLCGDGEDSRSVMPTDPRQQPMFF